MKKRRIILIVIIAAGAAAYYYTSRGNSRGRLLRPEDFDAKFGEAK